MQIIQYNKPKLLSEYEISNQIFKLYIEKTLDSVTGLDHYFFKIYTRNNNKTECAAYLYCYLNQDTADYVGTYVKQGYRGQGLSSILMAHWITFCLEHGITNLKTNKSQRKPFLLYILKKYSFEIENPTLYDTSINTISILLPETISEKWLHFRNKNEQSTFEKGRIAREDNYIIIPDLTGKFILDQILLSNIYQIQDENEAYNRARKRLNRN